MYICRHICRCIGRDICRNICRYVCRHICRCICRYICRNICRCICRRRYICRYIYRYICLYNCRYIICTYILGLACTCALCWTFMHVSSGTWPHTSVFTYVYTYSCELLLFSHVRIVHFTLKRVPFVCNSDVVLHSKTISWHACQNNGCLGSRVDRSVFFLV